MGNIVKIREKVVEVKEITLPDGNYSGVWGGNEISVFYKGKSYELETDEGVRGVGYQVVVSIKDGKGTFLEINN